MSKDVFNSLINKGTKNVKTDSKVNSKNTISASLKGRKSDAYLTPHTQKIKSSGL